MICLLDSVISIVVSVIAGIILMYIDKWLDSDK